MICVFFCWSGETECASEAPAEEVVRGTETLEQVVGADWRDPEAIDWPETKRCWQGASRRANEVGDSGVKTGIVGSA